MLEQGTERFTGQKALRTTLTEQEIEVLKNFMATLKEEADFDISPITDEKPGKDA